MSMAKYVVEMQRTIREYVCIEVEAESCFAAEEVAFEAALNQSELQWQDGDFYHDVISVYTAD